MRHTHTYIVWFIKFYRLRHDRKFGKNGNIIPGERINLSAVPTIRDLVRKFKPFVLFLCETIVHSNKIEEIHVWIGFDGAFAVDSIRRSRGLACLWKSPFDCNLIYFSVNFIIMEVALQQHQLWHFTGYYGYLEIERRKETWDFLRTLAQDNTLPWCIMGDFNDILSNEDKWSQIEHPPWRIRGFWKAVIDCTLVDIPMTGYQFTWSKGRDVNGRTKERIDWAMATQDWLYLFPNATLTNLIADRLYHSPIILHFINSFLG